MKKNGRKKEEVKELEIEKEGETKMEKWKRNTIVVTVPPTFKFSPDFLISMLPDEIRSNLV